MLSDEMGLLSRIHAAYPGTVFVSNGLIPGSYALNKDNPLWLFPIELDFPPCRAGCRTEPLELDSRDDILIRAFKKGYHACRKRLGDEYDSWEWGDVHQAEFRNQTLGESGIKPVERIFNRGPVATAGGTMQVNRESWSVEEPFKVRTHTSLRQIIDLGNLDAGLMIIATGQSGHSRHRHYDDMIEPWRLIEYHPSLWKRSDLEDQLKDRLILQPASSD